MRKAFGGPVILSGGYDAATAEAALAAGEGELVAFGRPYLANPDLIARFSSDAPLNAPRQDLFYTPGTEGYIDYPTAAWSRRALRSDICQALQTPQPPLTQV